MHDPLFPTWYIYPRPDVTEFWEKGFAESTYEHSKECTKWQNESSKSRCKKVRKLPLVALELSTQSYIILTSQSPGKKWLTWHAGARSSNRTLPSCQLIVFWGGAVMHGSDREIIPLTHATETCLELTRKLGPIIHSWHGKPVDDIPIPIVINKRAMAL